MWNEEPRETELAFKVANKITFVEELYHLIDWLTMYISWKGIIHGKKYNNGLKRHCDFILSYF